jgi:hypothetical protein
MEKNDAQNGPAARALEDFYKREAAANSRPESRVKKHKCKNCGTLYVGNFCPQCGQSVEEKRLNWHSFGIDLLSYFGIDNGFSYSILRLFYKPGEMIREFIYGKRKSYFRPFQLLFGLALIYPFVFQLKYGTIDASKIETQENVVSERIEDRAKDLTDDTPSKADDQFFSRVLDSLRKSRSNDKAFSALVMLPFATISAFWIFANDRKKRHYSFVDILYSQSYVSSQALLLSCLLLPFLPPGNIVLTIIVVPLTIWTYKDLYQCGWAETVLKYILATFLSLMMLSLTVTIFTMAIEGIRSLAMPM